MIIFWTNLQRTLKNIFTGIRIRTDCMYIFENVNFMYCINWYW